MAPKLLCVLVLLQACAIIAVPLISNEDEEDVPSNQSPMKEPATSSFLRLFSDTIAAVPVAVLFAENSENTLTSSSREPRKGRRIDDRPKGFMIFETADGSYEGIGPFIEFSSEINDNSDEYLPAVGLLPSSDDSNSWFMRSETSDPVIISEIVFDNSQESSDESGFFPSEFWVNDSDEQVAVETANDNHGFVAMDYFLPVGTWGSPRMVNEESVIFFAETNDEQVPLVIEEKRLMEVPGDQLVPVMLPSDENVMVFHWSDDQITLPGNRPFKEESQEISVSVPVRQDYPLIMPVFPRFLSPWDEYTKKSDERLSNLPQMFII